MGMVRASSQTMITKRLRLMNWMSFFFQAEDGIRDYKDWSSDVCSSDLRAPARVRENRGPRPAGRSFHFRASGADTDGDATDGHGDAFAARAPSRGRARHVDHRRA